jgi:hypothetical protein
MIRNTWLRGACVAAATGALVPAWAQLPAATSIDADLEARAAFPAVLGPERSRVVGTYSGIVGCRGAIDRFTITLETDARGFAAATYTRQPWVQGLPRPADTPAAGTQRLVGAYDGRTGVFGLRPVPGAPRDPQQSRPLRLLGVFQDGAAGLVMRPRLADGSWCDIHVARRGDDLPREWRAVADQPPPRQAGGGFAILRLGQKVDEARDALRRRCEAPLMPWLQQLSTLADSNDVRRGAMLPNLFSDTLFVPHFGKPFSALSGGERTEFDVQLRGSCSLNKDARLQQLATLLPSELPLAFMNLPQGFPDIDKVASNIVFGELRRWRDHARARLEEVARQAQHPGLVEQWLAAAQPMTELLLAAERRSFDEFARTAKTEMGMALLMSRIEQSPMATQPTLEGLERLITETRAARREMPTLSEADFQRVQERLASLVAAQAVPAADAWAAAARGAEDVHQMARWREQFPQLVALLPEPRRQALFERIGRNRFEVLTRLAQQEAAHHDTLREPARPALAALERLVAEQARLERSYGTLLAEAPFAAANAARAAARAQLLQAAEPELLAALTSAPHLSALKALRSRYLVAADAGEGAPRRVADAWQARAQAITPFLGYPAEDYFSALYAGDFDTVRRADQQLVARARATLAGVAPMLRLYDLMLGGGRSRTGPATELAEAGVARITHLSPMLALYLGRWQVEARYKPCLEPSAKITVITTVTTTMKERFGLESTTTRQSSQIFYVPARHEALALQVGLADSKGLSELTDLFLAPGGALTTTAVLDSLQQMMRTLDCRGPEAQQMERQMLKYWVER